MARDDVRAFVDGWWTSFESIIEGVQDTYLGGNTIHYQQLWTHTDANIPAINDAFNGATTPDNMDAQPTDQGEGNADVGLIILTNIPTRFRQDVYGDPVGGIGYTVTLSFVYNGPGGNDLENKRVIHKSGPQPWRAVPWFEVIPE
jgi:hypothetical protein